MLEHLTLEQFAACLNQTFKIQLDPSTLEVVLVRAEGLGGRATPSGRRQPFSLVFRGPNEPTLPQRIYRLDHPDMGSLEIFLVPIGPDRVGMRYEAIFT